MIRPIRHIIGLCIFALLQICLFDSCKIRYTANGASIPADARTVSVKYFQNNAPLASPTLSATFTEALKDILNSQTKLSLTDKTADLAFEGSIVGYSTAPVAIQSNNQAALNRLTITVAVKYINTKDEKKNFESNFSRYADYPSTQSLAAVESELIRNINKQLTEDIFNRAFNNW